MNQPPPNAPDHLGRAYQALIQNQSWELDVPEPATGAAATLPKPPAAKRPTAVSDSPTSVPPSPIRIIEAMLFVGGDALTAEATVEIIRGLEIAHFHEIIDQLNQSYREQGRPYHVEKREVGYVLALRPGYRFLAKKIYSGLREARLTQPAIDVLAIVAYRQPVTRQEVETVRGHESGSILRQLVRRGLIAVANRAESGGREVQYETTGRFLEFFGLNSLDELPQTEELQRL